jgi:hypothetical protein
VRDLSTEMRDWGFVAETNVCARYKNQGPRRTLDAEGGKKMLGILVRFRWSIRFCVLGWCCVTSSFPNAFAQQGDPSWIPTTHKRHRLSI